MCDPKLKCPKCGSVSTEAEAIVITCTQKPELDGDFCLVCIAAWIAANIPRLERVKEGE